MSSTHLSLHYHVVFSTKDRHPWIKPRLRDELHRYLGACLKTLDGVPEEIGGVDDHAHMLMGLRATHCLADVLREIKKVSSRWVHQQNGVSSFAWQEGNGEFTVSESNIVAVRNYIATQVEHHRKLTFREEYLELLRANHVDYDERFLW